MNISNARERQGMAQSELAERLKVTQGAISQWETGKAKPRADMLIKLAGILNCTVDELLKEETEGEGNE